MHSLHYAKSQKGKDILNHEVFIYILHTTFGGFKQLRWHTRKCSGSLWIHFGNTMFSQGKHSHKNE